QSRRGAGDDLARARLGDHQHGGDPRRVGAGRPLPVLRARAHPAPQPALRARGLGGGDRDGQHGRGHAGPARHASPAAGVAAEGDGGRAERCPGDEGAHRPRRVMRHRRALAVTPPVLFLLVSLLHPLPDWAHIVDSLAPRWTLWMAVHVAQLVLVPLLVFSVWMLLGGLTVRRPGLARAALIVFAAFYSAFDTIVGLGTGLLVRRAMLLDGA